MIPFRPRQLLSPWELLSFILDAGQQHEIEGITCLGGEPFLQAGPLARLCTLVRQHHLSVLVFTGYSLGTLQESDRDDWRRLLQQIDVLIDGPYLAQQHTSNRRWIGSANQQIHFLSERYSPLDSCWTEPNSLEVHFNGQELQISGFPHPEWLKRLRPLQESLAAQQDPLPPPSFSLNQVYLQENKKKKGS